MDDALSGIHRTSLEPRGGNEPPRPRRRSHGCGPAFCYSTRHIFDYLIQVLIKIIKDKFQTIPFRSSFSFDLKAK